MGWGGYLRSDGALNVTVTLRTGGASQTADIELDSNWQRRGDALAIEFGGEFTSISFHWSGDAAIEFWGLDCGAVTMPAPDAATHTHLMPETLYLAHEVAMNVDIDPEASTRFDLSEGAKLSLKKCCYCSRFLPLDNSRPGVLAFHKHNAKLTKHQNECRACKKWRINDSFNPMRTPDQLHESSTITRERKLLLREPAILQAIKERTGAGLRSIIFNKFGGKCFRCEVAVTLESYQLDHTRPLAYLWPIDEHATCLCAACNNEKKEKFPVDFYTADQLEQLSTATGLPLETLQKKELNAAELERVLTGLQMFSREWDPRTFAATARKIQELRPDVDLLALLAAQYPEDHTRLTAELSLRPPAVEVSEA